MKKTLIALLASFVTTVAVAAQPIGYLGIGLVYKDGKLAAANILGLAPNETLCLRNVQAAIGNFMTHAPKGITVNGACVPVPPANAAADQPGSTPAPKNPADPLNSESFQQVTRA